MVSSRFAGNFLVDLIGVWQHGTYRAMPVGGLCYYMTAPESIAKAFLEPLHSLLYILFMLGSCAFLSVKWIDVSLVITSIGARTVPPFSNNTYNTPIGRNVEPILDI